VREGGRGRERRERETERQKERETSRDGANKATLANIGRPNQNNSGQLEVKDGHPT
jgi:hypothetical protein